MITQSTLEINDSSVNGPHLARRSDLFQNNAPEPRRTLLRTPLARRPPAQKTVSTAPHAGDAGPSTENDLTSFPSPRFAAHARMPLLLSLAPAAPFGTRSSASPAASPPRSQNPTQSPIASTSSAQRRLSVDPPRASPALLRFIGTTLYIIYSIAARNGVSHRTDAASGQGANLVGGLNGKQRAQSRT